MLAKQALQIEEISGGRFAINLVNGWFKPEIERAGIHFAEHDDRYAYGREWITVVESLLRGQRTSFRGRFFEVDDYVLRPRAETRARPRVYLGGESVPARALAADVADVWFVNGQPYDDVARLLADVGGRPRPAGAEPLRFGLSAFVIARETRAEAEEALAYAWELAALDRPAVEKMLDKIDHRAVMFQTHARNPAIGTNGGTAAGLVGSYDEVAERIGAFHRLGIETFMLQFQPFEAEMRRFAEQVIPRVRSLSAASPTPVSA